MTTVIFGAGKIARGFIGHLLFKSARPFTFVEAAPALADLLRGRKQYSINILDKVRSRDRVTGFGVVDFADKEEVVRLLAAETDLVFISVGGKNLGPVAELLRTGLAERFRRKNPAPINVILCENWTSPAKVVEAGVLAGASEVFAEYLAASVGITEAVVMRSAIEPTKEDLAEDPLCVNVQNYWHLPVDASRFKGRDFPKIEALEFISDFNGFLEKKFYTYNAANATVSYLGYLKGYTYISEAAQDPEIVANLMKVYEETGRALSAKLGIDYEEQLRFAGTSLNKLQNVYLVDYIERNARDPIRKLGPSDRLIGPARMVIQNGGRPEALAESIAAAFYYDNPVDPLALELKALREREGVERLLDSICRLGPEDGLLKTLVLEKVEALKKRGWIKAP